MSVREATVILQARMSSSRLPGKVLLDIAGEPMLARVVRRARRAQSVSQVVVATTTDPADDAIEDFCRQRGYPVFRGSVYDVLDRFYQAARAFQADPIVRLTGDCPLMDPHMIDQVVAAFNGCPPPTGFRYCDGYGGKPSPTPLSCGEAKASAETRASAEAGTAYDFAANRLPPPWKRTFPIGLDIEVCRFAGLERAWRDATLPYEREHVMPYFYDQQGRYNIVLIDNLQDYGDLRWTVDTPEDLELVRQMFAYFKVNDLPDRIGPDRKSPGRSGLVQDDFSWLDVLDLVEAHPELSGINAHVRHKTLTEVDKRSTVT